MFEYVLLVTKRCLVFGDDPPVNKEEMSSVSGLIIGIPSSVFSGCDGCLFRRNVVVLLSGGIIGRLFRKFSVLCSCIAKCKNKVAAWPAHSQLYCIPVTTMLSGPMPVLSFNPLTPKDL
jgi:hypothetical protein